jgi:predicted cupin superfamily sugar epimerase
MGLPPQTGPDKQNMVRPRTAEILDLAPHPEGGWYRQTWASDISFEPPGYAGKRTSATAIYFLLCPEEESRWHRVRSDELWLWHSGAPLVLNLAGTGELPESAAETIVVGPDLSAGQRPQALVPAGYWQSARSGSDDEVLVSCIVSPGFDFADFTLLP